MSLTLYTTSSSTTVATVLCVKPSICISVTVCVCVCVYNAHVFVIMKTEMQRIVALTDQRIENPCPQ